METTPIYSKPIKSRLHATDDSKKKSVDPATEVVKKFNTKYDTINPIALTLKGSQSAPSIRQNTSTKTANLRDYQDNNLAVDETDLITDEELIQIESFYKSQHTQVFVCECLANLYHMTMGPSNGDAMSSQRCPSAVSTSSWSSGRSDSSSDSSTLASSPAWTLALTGIPVLLFDRGRTKARSKRRLQIVLAERGSGFALWFDVLDNLSNYRSLAPTFHAMHYSGDHRQMVGFSFDRVQASTDFMRRVELLTSDPLNISLSVPKSRSSSKRRPAKRSTSVGPGSGARRPASAPNPKNGGRPKKSDISLPCCFQHVTSVDLNDKEKLFSLATLVNGLKDLSITTSDNHLSLITRHAPSSLTNSPLRTKSSSDISNSVY